MHAVTTYITLLFYESNQATIESKSNYDDLYDEKMNKEKKKALFYN